MKSIFPNSKCIFYIYDNSYKEKLDKNIAETIIHLDINNVMLKSLSTPDYNSLIKIASEYADAVIKPSNIKNKTLEKLISDFSPKNKVHEIEEGDKFVDSHYKLYNEILK